MRTTLSNALLTTVLVATLAAHAAAARADFLPSGGICGTRCRLADDDSGLVWTRVMPQATLEQAEAACESQGGRLPSAAELQEAVSHGLAAASETFASFGAQQSWLWTEGSQRCAALADGQQFQQGCGYSTSAYRCVIPGGSGGYSLACNPSMRQVVVVQGPDGTWRSEVRYVPSPGFRGRAEELVNRSRNYSQENDAAVARVFVEAYDSIDRFADAAESLLAQPLSESFFARRLTMRDRFEDVMRSMTTADAYLRQPPESRAFTPAEVEDLRCEAKRLLVSVIDPGVVQGDVAPWCPPDYERFKGVFCHERNTGHYMANFRGEWWDFVDRRDDASGITHQMRRQSTGEVYWLSPDEFRGLLPGVPY